MQTSRILFLALLHLCCAPLFSATTPLHEAAKGGDVFKCMQLLKQGADANAQDNNGNTPFHLATQGGHRDVSLLFMNGYINIELDVKNNQGDIPLHLAVQAKENDVVAICIECMQFDKQNRINVKNNNNNTALHLAVQCGNKYACIALMRNGANIHLKNNQGKTPLELATQHNGDTLLHWCVDLVYKEGCTLLLKDGLNIHLPNNEGTTALDLANNLDAKKLNQSAQDAIKKTIAQYEDIKISGYVKGLTTHDTPTVIIALLLTFSLGGEYLQYLQD